MWLASDRFVFIFCQNNYALSQNNKVALKFVFYKLKLIVLIVPKKQQEKHPNFLKHLHSWFASLKMSANF